MSSTAPLQTLAAKPQSPGGPARPGLLLQRKCDCGSTTPSLTGECAECSSKKRLQTKLTIGASNDPLEQEADRIADQVMAVSAHSLVNHAPPRIQRYSGKAVEGSATAPASVDRVLAASGRALEPTLRHDMEQRFGHDFSRVRVHFGGAAEQSARDVSANAYTVGHDVVFGAGRFAPETHEGRRLLAHELAHVLQQSGTEGIRFARRDESRNLSFIATEAKSAPARKVIAYDRRVLVQRVPCESLAPPNCSEGTCDEGKKCVGSDWPVCGCWTQAEIERWRRARQAGQGGSGYEGGGGRSGGGGSSDSWDA